MFFILITIYNNNISNQCLCCFRVYKVSPLTMSLYYDLSQQQSYEIDIILPILQMRKLRFREVKWLAQGHMATNTWWSQEKNSDLLTSILCYPLCGKLWIFTFSYGFLFWVVGDLYQLFSSRLMFSLDSVSVPTSRQVYLWQWFLFTLQCYLKILCLPSNNALLVIVAFNGYVQIALPHFISPLTLSKLTKFSEPQFLHM